MLDFTEVSVLLWRLNKLGSVPHKKDFRRLRIRKYYFMIN